jgi:predicted enzyme related to lactoylglutathione lyase
MSCGVLNVTFDSTNPGALAEFWSAATGHPVHESTRPGNPFWAVGPAEAHGLSLVFVPVQEPKRGKNRVHVDILPRDGSQAEEIDRLLGLGATMIDDRRRLEGGGWAVLADPEGNEFCVEGDGPD